LTLAFENPQEPTEQAGPRSRQEQFEQALKIATEVVARAKAGNKTCMSILRKAGALRG
jgi:hypothetical protein